MTEQLALKYRPVTFDDLVGQRAVHHILRAMVATNRVPSGMLFKGCRGTGKTTTARILAAAVNCEAVDRTARPCTECVSCKSVAHGTSLDLVEIDGASNGLVDDIRDLREQVLYSVGGQYRVVVLDEAHSMSTAAFNALLKTLEEPPPATVFILCTTEPGRIPDTVLSRLMPFSFGKIAVEDITARLTGITAAEGLTVEAALLAHIAGHADGAMRDAVMTLDQLSRAGITTLAGWLDLTGDADDGPSLLRCIADADPAAAYQQLDTTLTRTGNPHALTGALIATLRDLLILHSGGTITAHGHAHTRRAELATQISSTAAFGYLTTLWELSTKVRVGDDRHALDLAVAILLDKATKLRAAVHPSAAEPARKLTLAELTALSRRTSPG